MIASSTAKMYLGIDQSLTGTAICVLDAHGSILFLETVDPGKLRGAARLHLIKSRVLSRMVAGTKFVVLEGYSYNSTGKVFELGEIGGVLKLLAFEHNLPILIVAPTALKKFATSNSMASKEAMIFSAKEKGANAADDNQADAFHLATVALMFDLTDIPRTRAQMEVLRQLADPQPRAHRRARKMIKNTL